MEGIAGAGKSTAVAAAGALLRRRGVKVAVVDRYTSSPKPYVDSYMWQVPNLIWGHKFLSKLSPRPGVGLVHARSSFAKVISPDLVIRVDLNPAVAAVRKQVIAVSEAGNHEGIVEIHNGSFVAYQRRLGTDLDTLGQVHGWQCLDISYLSGGEVAARVAAIVADHIGLVGQPAAPPGSM